LGIVGGDYAPEQERTVRQPPGILISFDHDQFRHLLNM
jgi:hypothetical protein